MAQAITERMGPDPSEISGIDTLIDRMKQANTIEDWSFILQDYIAWGNLKVHKTVAIFNMNSASDCPNRWTDNCQVGGNECYAVQTEKSYPQPLDYRRRQEYLWDCLDSETWAKAFLQIVERKRNPVTAIRFSEAGDFRHEGDIIKVNRIAEILSDHDISVYTYSASDYLDWSLAQHFTVNQSNNRDKYGVRRFMAVPSKDDAPDNAVWCPFDLQADRGVEASERIKCGECRMCIDEKAPDVFITLH